MPNRPPMRALAGLLAALLAAGCLAVDPPPAATTPDAPALEAALSAGKPTSTKFVLDVTNASGLPVDDLLGRAREVRKSFDVPDGTGAVQIAIDLTLLLGGPSDEMAVRITGPDGEGVFESPATDTSGKLLEIVPAPAAGAHELVATFRGTWQVGLVATFFPVGYTPGLVLSVSTPDSKEVDHTFHPGELAAKAGRPTRITLYDYDPHAGVRNLQHNLAIEGVPQKTEGRTTWGEVRVLDFAAPAPGRYAYVCEYHEEALRGTLVVT